MAEHSLSGLEPRQVFDYFYQITQVPRPSKKEEKIRTYIIETAKKLNREIQEDTTGNIVVRKAASAGLENAPAVVLQGHLDMVCEKNKDVTMDFDKDPIRPRVDGEWIKATGTTLGADNGIAVATMLAILSDDSLVHGPLEMLFTIDEETGLTGATHLDPKMLKGRRLINLDSEEEGVLFVGCAGAKDATITFPVKWKDVHDGMTALQIKVEGAVGGHSGLDIHLGRANAIKILARILWSLHRSYSFRLSHLHGGSKRNAIPREAEAVLAISNEDVASFKKDFQRLQKAIKPVYHSTDPHLKMTLTETSTEKPHVMKKSQTAVLINLLHALPHGVMAMSKELSGLVETSVNLATIEMTHTSILIGSNQRSFIETEKDALVDRVRATAELAGAEMTQSEGYPGWKPDMKSKVLGIAKTTFQAMYGKEPHVTAIHAGLECGIIGEKFSGMEMISFGPTIQGAHSPDESLFIPSVKPFYEATLKMLEKLAQG
ncbi:aminoacyl-histidine dipeptidase [bacterium]|nr:aminoacyl-histidine dipeptidase [bacterium]